MIKIRAHLFCGQTLIDDFLLTIVPYGLIATSLHDENDKATEEFLSLRARKYFIPDNNFGDERREAYCYINAAIHNFALSEDDYYVLFPNQDFVSLYPADISYKFIHILKNAL